MIQSLDKEFFKLNKKRIELYANIITHIFKFISFGKIEIKGKLVYKLFYFVLNLTADILLKIPNFFARKKVKQLHIFFKFYQLIKDCMIYMISSTNMIIERLAQ